MNSAAHFELSHLASSTAEQKLTSASRSGEHMVELFSGAGLLGEGFSLEGFRPVLAVDSDWDSVATYNRNLAPIAVVGDVAEIRGELPCNVIVAGPPCQGFSSLGSRNPRDIRNRLCLHIVHWTRILGPEVVVIENVPQFLNSPQHKHLTKIFQDEGYLVTRWVLDACDYGAAQFRVRSFTIASKIGAPVLPKRQLTRHTVRDAFKGLEHLRDDPLNVAPKPSQLALQRFQSTPPNGGKKDIMSARPDLCPKSWFSLGAQATDVWGRMNPDGQANTLRCCFQNASKGRYVHHNEDRVITLREGARLQGLPDKWTFAGNRTSIARQIGNGVPIPLARAVASSIRRLFCR